MLKKAGLPVTGRGRGVAAWFYSCCCNVVHTSWSPSYESLHTIAKLCGNSSQSGEPVR